MADTSSATDDTPTPSTETTDSDSLGDGGRKALDAERKARRDAEAEAKELAKRLQAIEDKDKTETERLTAENRRLTEERDTATVSAARLSVALDKGLTLAQAKRLVGSTEEELAADADELLVDLGVTKQSDDSGTDRPKPDAKPRVQLQPGGGEEPAAPEEKDLRKIGARMFGR